MGSQPPYVAQSLCLLNIFNSSLNYGGISLVWFQALRTAFSWLSNDFEVESLETLPGICICEYIRGDSDERLVSGSLFKADSMVPATQVTGFKSGQGPKISILTEIPGIPISHP